MALFKISHTYIHMMYFPWNSKGILQYEYNFDHSIIKSFKKFLPTMFSIQMWTLSKTKLFVSNNYPEYYKILFCNESIKHPTQIVDFCRLLVVYHYGGIYWQFESIPKVPLQTFLPDHQYTCKLFIECIISKHFSFQMSSEPIRKGKPEELTRIANQIFSAKGHCTFLKYCLNKSFENLQKYIPKRDYDILYIGGNAMISEAYNEFQKKHDIQLEQHTKKFIQISSHGSWRNTF